MKPLKSPLRHAELVSASISPHQTSGVADGWTLKQVQGDGFLQGKSFGSEFKR